MKKIIYLNQWKTDIVKEIFPEIQILNSNDQKFDEHLLNAEAIMGLGIPVDEAFLKKAPKLKIVSLTSVGYDNCDVEAMTKRGVLLTNTPDILTETTADLAFALLMATARRITEGSEMIRRGDWKGSVTEEIFGTDIHGKRLGILGLGRIGEAIARRGHFGFGMKISYHSRHEKKDLNFKADYRSLDELLKESDFVVVTIPLSKETKGLLGSREFGLMKKEAIFINIARGPIVDEKALIEVLRDRKIRAAGLDVFDKEPLPMNSPLLELKNVVLTPHIGSATDKTREDMVRLAGSNIQAYFRGETPKNLVNREALS